MTEGYVDPRAYNRKNFPASQATPVNAARMRVLDAQDGGLALAYARDVAYVHRGGEVLTLQIVSPVAFKSMRRFPCVLYVQGSGWRTQQVYANLANMAVLAGMGYVTAIVQYRSSETEAFPAQAQDACEAVRFMRKHAAGYRVDPDNLFLFGDSSGGHTALLAGFTRGEGEFDTDAFPGVSAAVNAIADFYGPVDISLMNAVPSTLDHVSPNSPEGRLLGGRNVLENPELAWKANPIRYIAPDAPPVLIAHGTRDTLVPFEQSVLLADALEAAGCEYEFFRVEGADHGGPPFFGAGMLAHLDAFFKKHIKPTVTEETL